MSVRETPGRFRCFCGHFYEPESSYTEVCLNCGDRLWKPSEETELVYRETKERNEMSDEPEWHRARTEGEG